MIDIPAWHWIVLIAWFSFLLLLDLFVFHRKDKAPTIKQAVLQSLFWVSLGIGLGFVMWPLYGAKASSEYFAGFLIEQSLSIDNVFVWAIILSFFKIPRKYQHRVLFWGVFGALVLRALFIFAGVAMLERFVIAFVLLGMLLIFSGIKLFVGGAEDFDPETSRGIRFIKRYLPLTHELYGHSFFITKNGKRYATILFLALLSVEFTDIIFAIDSVPAILAVARDPLIIFASNAAAILGLRSLYFVFDAMKDKFILLGKGLGVILVGVGIKMMISPDYIFGIKWFDYHVSTAISLIAIISILVFSVAASLFVSSKSENNKSGGSSKTIK